MWENNINIEQNGSLQETPLDVDIDWWVDTDFFDQTFEEAMWWDVEVEADNRDAWTSVSFETVQINSENVSENIVWGNDNLMSGVWSNNSKLPKMPLLNKWLVAWVISFVVFFICLNFVHLKVWQGVFLNLLLIIFLVLRFIYLLKYNKFKDLEMDRNWIFVEKSMSNFFKRWYSRLFIFAVAFTVAISLFSWWRIKSVRNVKESVNAIVNTTDRNYWDDRLIEIKNEYAGCNCFWPDAYESYAFENSDYFKTNVDNKFMLEFTIEQWAATFLTWYRDEIVTELYKNINDILWDNCFWSWSKLCDLSKINAEQLYYSALLKVDLNTLKKWSGE